MEVAAGQDGIQRLLQAEQEAQAIVSRARKSKSERLKQAKDEADKEIAAYKAQRERDFQSKIATDSSSSQENVTRLGEESSKAVSAVQASIQERKQEVLKLLLDHVTTVKLVK